MTKTPNGWAPVRVVRNQLKVRVLGGTDVLDHTEQSFTRIWLLSLGRSTGYHNGSIGTGNVSYALHAPPFDRTYPLTPTPMTRRKMRKSHLVACLPIFAGLASAQLVYPNCTTGWDWVSHSLQRLHTIRPFALFRPID